MRILAFFCFLLSLILAPWQVKLIILTVVLGSVYQIWLYRGEPEIETEGQELSESLSNKDTKQANFESKYRGVSYQPHHRDLRVESEESIVVKYRGKPCHIIRSHPQSQSQPQFELKYRGVSINPQDTASQNRDSEETQSSDL